MVDGEGHGMDHVTRRRWRDLAETLYVLRHVDATGRKGEPELNGPPGRLADAVEGLVAAAGGEWTPGVQAGIMALPQAAKADASDPTSAPLGTACTTYMRALRHALLAVTGEGARIPASEREWVRRAVGALPDHAHLADAIPATAHHGATEDGRPPAVRFAFAWRPRRGKGPMVLDTAMVGLRHVVAGDAPTVATLRPDGGLPFALREIDGVLHRPVFAPGSWEPATVGTFEEACAGNAAWVDNPFMPPPSWDASVAALADVAVPGAPAKDGGERDAAMRACLARAGGLVAVDGVVHKPCPEPTLHLAMRRLPRPGRDNMANGVRMAWSMGGIDSSTCQAPDRVFVPVIVCDALAGLDRGDPAEVDRYGAWHVRTTDLGLPLGDTAALAELGACAAVAFEAFPFHYHVRPYLSEVPCVADVDARRFPPDPDALVRALARHARVAGGAWADVADALDGDGTVDDAETAVRLRAMAEADVPVNRLRKPRPAYVVGVDATGHDELGRAGVKALATAVAATLERRLAMAVRPPALAGFAP